MINQTTAFVCVLVFYSLLYVFFPNIITLNILLLSISVMLLSTVASLLSLFGLVCIMIWGSLVIRVYGKNEEITIKDLLAVKLASYIMIGLSLKVFVDVCDTIVGR